MKTKTVWEHATFPCNKCDVCGLEAKHCLFERDPVFRGDDTLLKSFCNEHFSPHQ